MGRAEDVYFNNAAQKKVHAREQSERSRTNCRDVLVPRLIELGRVFLEKQEAADFPIAPTGYSFPHDAATWVIGYSRDETVLLSDGRVLTPSGRASGTFITDEFEPYDIDESSGLKYDDSHERRMLARIERVENLIERVDEAVRKAQ